MMMIITATITITDVITRRSSQRYVLPLECG